MYSTIYSAILNDNKIIRTEQICFSNLFNFLDSENNGSITVYMYPKLSENHNLSFSKEEIEYVFDKLSYIFETPQINEIENDGLSITVNFCNKSAGYVKVLTTIIRYFYELNGDPSEINNDLNVIMRNTIEYCKLNLEESFIEILQLFHHDTNYGNNHSIVFVPRTGAPIAITSNESFIKKMNDFSVKNIWSTSNAVFKNTIFNDSKVLNDNYSETFKNIPRV